MIKQWCIAVGLWLARLGGWQEPPIPEPVIREIVKEVVKEVRVPEPYEVIKEVIHEVRVPEPYEVIKEVVKEVQGSPAVQEVIKEVIKEVRVPEPYEVVKEVIKEVRFGLPTVPADILQATKFLVADAHRRSPERSGESKRAQVYWQLINAYPNVSKQVLSIAIEEAVCSVS